MSNKLTAAVRFAEGANAPAAEEAMRWLRSAVTVNHDPPILLLPGVSVVYEKPARKAQE
jgi:hypothetical protein